MPRYRAIITTREGHAEPTFLHADNPDAARQTLESRGFDPAEITEVPELVNNAQVHPCPACSLPVSRSAASCNNCGQPMPTVGDATGGIIPYKNPPALIAYYLGLFSLFPVLGLFLAIPALFLGLKGYKNYKQQPEIKGHVHAWIGIVMGALFTAIWGLVVILIAASLAAGV